MRRLWIACGWAAACTGTGGGGGDDTSDATAVDGCELGAPPTLEIGTGEDAYEPIGDTVNLVHGPQGGYHVLVAFEATHLDNSEFATALVEGTIGGETVARAQPWLDFRCNPDTHTLQTWGTLLIYPLQPDELDQQETTITADITAADVDISASLTTTIVDPLL